jgi:nitrogen fixation/metabolism regulation signal transduction histidine kinase
MNRLMQEEEPDRLKEVRHDIRNQLSNIQMAAEQLRYDISSGEADDSLFYLTLITESCMKINESLKEVI